MTLTERKHCDTCQQETVHLKENPTENLEEECLPCGWRTNEEYWKEKIAEVGLEQAKEEWEEIRDSQLNKKIESELTYEEKINWYETCVKTGSLFLSKKEQKQDQKAPLDYQPYLIGGVIGGGIIAFIWLVVVLIRRD